MAEQSTRRLRAAVAAAWWSILIFAAWMMLSWLGFMHIMRNRPGWILDAWGGGSLTWGQVQTVTIWFFGAIKIILFVAVLITLWLTIYIRRLQRP